MGCLLLLLLHLDLLLSLLHLLAHIHLLRLQLAQRCRLPTHSPAWSSSLLCGSHPALRPSLCMSRHMCYDYFYGPNFVGGTPPCSDVAREGEHQDACGDSLQSRPSHSCGTFCRTQSRVQYLELAAIGWCCTLGAGWPKVMMGPLAWAACPLALPGPPWADSGRPRPSCWATLGEKPCPPVLCWCCSFATGPAQAACPWHSAASRL